jgi:hypothetical protein
MAFQLLRLDKMKYEPVTLIMKGIVIYEPGSNRQGTVACLRDNTKWLSSSLFIHPGDSSIAPFQYSIRPSRARGDALSGCSPFLPATDRDADASQRRSAFFPRISNRVTDPCDGTVCPSNDNLHHGTAMLNFCTCRRVLLRIPGYSDQTELQLAAG